MTAREVELGDVAAWLRDFDAGDHQLLTLTIGNLDRDEAHQAIMQLLTLASLALTGTGGREPDAWLAALVKDQRRSTDLGSPP